MDEPTQRIDPKLVQAARMLAGMQPTKITDAPTQPNMAAPVETVAPHTAPPTDGATRKARILFVDDEERILTALRIRYSAMRYHVFTATDGTEALEFVKKFQPHVFVSDQRMPGMTGVELLRQVKEIAPSTVRLLLTGYSDLAAIVGSINEGEVFRFISKPWDNQELQNTVAEAADDRIGARRNRSDPTHRSRPDGCCGAGNRRTRGDVQYREALRGRRLPHQLRTAISTRR